MTQEENIFLLDSSVGSDWCCDTRRKQFFIRLALLDRIGVVTQKKTVFLLDSSVGSDWCCDTRRKHFFY